MNNKLFESARKTILHCAYWRGIWESLELSQLLYRSVQQSYIEMYTGIIEICYEIIDEIRENEEKTTKKQL